MKAFRLLSRFTKAASFSSQRFASTATNPRSSNFFYDGTEGGSAVYRHALRFQRPTVIEWQEQLVNSANFIGTLDRPLKRVVWSSGNFGVRTSLTVKTSNGSSSTFRIFLLMWGEVAKLSLEHLKPNDFIYVSGRLGSFSKAWEDGTLRTFYQVTVRELNYVSQCGQAPTCQTFASRSEEGGTYLEKYQDRLHLWHVFFANPYEWWDNRKCKINSKQPDFKHKDTGESLWLSPNDPPWVKRQLQLIDLTMAEQGRGEHATRSYLSSLVYDD